MGMPQRQGQACMTKKSVSVSECFPMKIAIKKM